MFHCATKQIQIIGSVKSKESVVEIIRYMENW